MGKLTTVNVVVILLVLSVGVYGATLYFQGAEFVEADVFRIDGLTLVVGVGCKGIVADTSPERADSIQLGLEGSIFERPNGHDLYAQTLENFYIGVESVSLDRYDGLYYYSTINLKSDDKRLALDSKPSDAFAVALRADAPILVNTTLLEEIGQNIC